LGKGHPSTCACEVHLSDEVFLTLAIAVTGEGQRATAFVAGNSDGTSIMQLTSKRAGVMGAGNSLGCFAVI
jgi:hypothetical protein